MSVSHAAVAQNAIRIVNEKLPAEPPACTPDQAKDIYKDMRGEVLKLAGRLLQSAAETASLNDELKRATSEAKKEIESLSKENKRLQTQNQELRSKPVDMEEEKSLAEKNKQLRDEVAFLTFKLNNKTPVESKRAAPIESKRAVPIESKRTISHQKYQELQDELAVSRRAFDELYVSCVVQRPKSTSSRVATKLAALRKTKNPDEEKMKDKLASIRDDVEKKTKALEQKLNMEVALTTWLEEIKTAGEKAAKKAAKGGKGSAAIVGKKKKKDADSDYRTDDDDDDIDGDGGSNYEEGESVPLEGA